MFWSPLPVCLRPPLYLVDFATNKEEQVKRTYENQIVAGGVAM